MVWLTDAKLAAAVSHAGGLGSLGPNAGQTVVTRDPVETAERMRAEIRKVRALTDKPFSVNVLPMQNGEDIYTSPIWLMPNFCGFTACRPIFFNIRAKRFFCRASIIMNLSKQFRG